MHEAKYTERLPVRMDAETKRIAQETAEKLGMDTSTYIRFLIRYFHNKKIDIKINEMGGK